MVRSRAFARLEPRGLGRNNKDSSEPESALARRTQAFVMVVGRFGHRSTTAFSDDATMIARNIASK